MRASDCMILLGVLMSVACIFVVAISAALPDRPANECTVKGGVLVQTSNKLVCIAAPVITLTK